jgi:hypothetical protein
VSLLLAGLVFAGTSGALMAGRWLARRRGGAGEAAEAPADAPKPPAPEEDEARREVDAGLPERKNDPSDDSSPELPKHDAKKPARVLSGPKARLDGFICQLGDVVMRLTGEEAWLAGGLVLSEQVPIAVLFVAPDAGHDCAIYVRARPSESLWWLEPLDPNAVLVAGEPPSSVEHAGVRFDRARRLPLRLRRVGVGAPDTASDAVIVAEYTSAGDERLLVVKGNSGVVSCFRGLELEPGSFEVIASGDSTLE